MPTKEHQEEIEEYIRSSYDYWVDLKPKLNEMMISYSEFYNLIKGLVDDRIIEPHPNSNYGTLRITMRQELVVEPDLRFRLCTSNKNKHPYQPMQNERKSKFWTIISKYWWYVMIPLLLFVAYKFIEWN